MILIEKWLNFQSFYKKYSDLGIIVDIEKYIYLIGIYKKTSIYIFHFLCNIRKLNLNSNKHA